MNRSPTHKSRGVPLWLCAVVCASSCSPKDKVRGELMLAVSADASIPKDINQVLVEVLNDNGNKQSFTYPILPGDLGKPMPGTLAIVPPNEGGQHVRIRLIAERDPGTGAPATPRVVREAVVNVPTDRIAMLPMPLRWLCDGLNRMTDDGTSYQSDCATDETCAAGTCVSAVRDTPKLHDYDPHQVFGGGDDTGHGGTCMNVPKCFADASAVTPDADCTLDLPNGVSAGDVNIAMLPASDGYGECATGTNPSCFIPLDQDPDEGWALVGGRIALPKAVCTGLEVGGKIQSVVLTTACPAKDGSVPICGAWSSVTTESDGASGAGGAGNASDASAQPPVPSQVGMTCDTAPRLAFPTIVTPNAVYLVEGIATVGSGFLSTTMMIGRAANGSLDPATCTLTSGVTVPVAECGMDVATVASSVYLIGGNTTGLTGTQNAVYRAEITNGSLTPFSVATLAGDGGATPVVLQTSRYAAEVVQVQNYVYVIGGWSSVNETNVASIERAQVDLATGNFVTNFAPAIDPKTGNPATLVVPRAYSVAVHLGSWIYVLGGTTQTADQPVPVSGPACQNEIQRASLDATGNLSSFSQVGTLPSGLCSAASYVSGNTMYVLGGLTDFNLTTGAATSTDAVLTAAIAADGTLGDFTASSVKLSYPVGSAGEAVIGKTVYLFNGSKGGTGATTSIQAVTFP